MSTIWKKILLEFEDKNRIEIFKKFIKIVLIFAGGLLGLWMMFWLIFFPQGEYRVSVRDPFSGFEYLIHTGDRRVCVTDVINYHPIKNGCLEIPESFWGMPVISVDLYSGIQEPYTSVRIPDSVIYLYGLQIKTLESVTGGSNVRIIGAHAFSQCENLTTVELGDKIEEVWWEAFVDCISLEEIRFGSYLKSIGECAFAGCENLKAVDLGDNLPIEIEEDAFYGTPWLDTDEGKKFIEEQE